MKSCAQRLDEVVEDAPPRACGMPSWDKELCPYHDRIARGLMQPFGNLLPRNKPALRLLAAAS